MHLAAAATSTDRREEKGDPVLRLAVAVSAVLVLSGLGGCGAATGDPNATGPTRAKAATHRLAEDRFRVLFRETGALMDRTKSVEASAEPSGPQEANRLFDLDESSPVRFVELVQTGEYSGWRCVGSDEDTFLTAFGSQDDGGGLQILLSDRQCARTAAEAVVVGDLATGQWTKGGGLMGDAKVGDEFPVAQLSAEGVEGDDQGQVDAEALNPQLLVDVNALANAVAQYAFKHQSYPEVAAADLVASLSVGTSPVASARSRVFAYRHGPGGFALCLVDADGNWARWNRLGQITSGTYTRHAELDDCAAPMLADD